MKRTIFILMALCLNVLGMQAQKKSGDTPFAESEIWEKAVAANQVWVEAPLVLKEKITKKTITAWKRTEKDDWFEPSGLTVKVPTVNHLEEVFPDLKDIDEDDSYVPMPWALTEEDGETVLHCYLRMPADIVTNFWLTDEEGAILDKETGISYRARRTEPDCYYKRFDIEGKAGSVVDFKIFFPQLPETTKNIAIYGVPNWGLRGFNTTISRISSQRERFWGENSYDSIPQFHHATRIVEAKDYDKDNFFTWSEYTDVHLIKPVPEGTKAIWRTPEATYLAIATEMNWRREYFGRGGDTYLIDKRGHQYKCKGVIDYPNDKLFWVQGYSADYFAIVLVFEPIPLELETITYIVPEGEPFNANFASWSGEVIPDLSIKELRANQKLFQYRERVMVE